MLWFFHPRPLSRKEVAVQMVARKEEAAPPTEFVIVDDGRGGKPDLTHGHALAADLAPAIRFHVAYRLGEYLSIVGEHVGYLVKKARRARRFAPGLLAALGCAMVAAAAHLAGAAWLAYAATAGVLLVGAFCLPFMVTPWVALLMTPIFLHKRWRMGSCGFKIDHEGIERVTALGNLTKSWRDVVAVHRYTQGYLMVFSAGAMPIPYRCLDAAQAQRLRALVASRPRERLSPA